MLLGQEYIRSSGVRALTRSATAPSAITGGETVEQLEVRGAAAPRLLASDTWRM